jgi:serine/threonine protein kinase
MDNWKAISPSPFPWEQEALVFLRERFPAHEPYRAWSNFEFIADDGSINEVDLLVLTPAGFFLVEIKSRPGTLSGDVHTWKWRHDGRDHVDDNPLFLTNRKAKRLKALLARQAASKGTRIPFIEPVVFCSAPDLVVQLPVAATARVCLRDEAPGRSGTTVAGVMDLLCRRAGLDAEQRTLINAPIARTVSRALEQAGVRPSTRANRAGEFRLQKLLFESAQGVFQDWLAVHSHSPGLQRRVRVYLAATGISAEQRESLVRAARRELEVGELLSSHEAILRVHGFRDSELGPALDFDHNAAEQRLDIFMASEPQLTLDGRFTIIRQVADALRFAHDKRVFHGGVAPHSILVNPGGEAGPLRVKLFNWQTSVRAERDTAGNTRLAGTVHQDLYWEEPAACFTAPEVLHNPLLGEEAARAADVFSLGALAYFVFSAKLPAASSAELAEKLKRDHGLRLSSVCNGIPESLDQLVVDSTHPEVASRLGTIDDFIQYLSMVEDDLTRPSVTVSANPLDAKPGDAMPGGWTVKARLGSGSTATTFLVQRKDEEAVLKMAGKSEHNERIQQEFQVLKRLSHRNIVRPIEVIEAGNLCGFVMQRAGEKTLAQKLRTEGPLPLEYLSRFGEDLIDAVRYLGEAAASHRDIKPENLGVGSLAGGGKVRLVLFDFSLAKTPVENLRAGTPGYLDPFLLAEGRKRWDLYAERYATAVTLYEMASGKHPIWSTDNSAPLQLSNEVTLESELFEPVVREGLTAFFLKALRRDHRQRFDNAEEMLRAWRQIFVGIDKPAARTTTHAVATDKLDLTTPVAALGLSPAAVSAVDRLGAVTIKDLLAVPQRRIERIPGFKIRLEVRDVYRTLARQFLRLDEDKPVVADADASPDNLDVIAGRIRSYIAARPMPDRAILEAVFGVEGGASGCWRDVEQLAKHLRLNRPAVEAALRNARQHWAHHQPEMTLIRGLLAQLIERYGGVVPGPLLAEALLLARGCSEAEPRRGHIGQSLSRAAAETEAGVQSPRFRLTWRNGIPLFAVEEALADYAARLGEVADDLAKQDPLPSERRVLDALSAVTRTPSTTPVSDVQLVRLGAAVSQHAAASSKNEIYPRGMPAERALKLAQNALSGMRELTVRRIRERVSARYPDATPVPDRPELDLLLEKAGLDLVWHPELQQGDGAYRFRAFDDASASTGTIITRRAATSVADLPTLDTPSEEIADARLLEQKLQRAVRDGAFLVLAVPPPWAQAAQVEIGSRFEVELRDADQLVIQAMRDAATELGADWDIVLRADAAARDTQDWVNLQMLVGQAMPKVEAQLAISPRTILLVNPGLLGRYGQLGVISRLAAQIGVTGSKLHGLWVLVPTDGQRILPTVDGTPIPVIGPAQWSPIGEAWLKNLHRSS